MRKIEVVLSDERLITPSGLCMVGQAMAKSDLIKKAARMRMDKRSQPQIKNGDILLTEIGMQTLGKTDFDYVNEFHKDEEYYKMSLGIAYGIPSESTLRMRLDAIGQSMNAEILSGNISLFKACHVQPTALTNGMVPLDIDVTPFDNSKSHKEGVSRTYKNFDGYAPIMAYIGTEGYGCNFELREGSQHCQNGTPDFLRETIAAAKQMTNQTLLVRMDSGNDAVENYATLHWDDSQVKFLVKHNFRRENRDEMAAELRKVCKNISYPREGKTVYIGSTWRNVHTKEKGDITIRMVYEIIDRTITANGQEMLFPDTEFNMYYTSLPDSDADIIKLYHNHAICEQFHSEIKTDMDMERMPSGKFDVPDDSTRADHFHFRLRSKWWRQVCPFEDHCLTTPFLCIFTKMMLKCPFIGLELFDSVPDAKTIWKFRNDLSQANAMEELFCLFDKMLEKEGLITHKGTIVDATFVDVPRQRNSRDENQKIKDGEIPEDWEKPENATSLPKRTRMPAGQKRITKYITVIRIM